MANTSVGLRRKRRGRILAIAAVTVAVLLALSAVVLAGKSTLGDFVWHDADADGQKDVGEVGINDVLVNLYQDGANGEPKDGTITPAELISTTLTALLAANDEPLDDNGYYDFDITGGTTSDPELYRVEIADSNFDPGGALEDYVFTGGVATADPNIATSNPWLEIVSLVQTDINTVDFPFALKGIEVVKTAGTAADGDIYYIDSAQGVTYTYVVTNTGEVALDMLAQGYGLVDNICSPVTYVSGDDGNDLLDVGEQWVYECVQTISIDTTNVVTATGNPVDDQGNDLPGNDATDSDDAVVDLVSPAITLAKTVYEGQDSGASCPGVELILVDVGVGITYCFEVTNSGDTYISVDETTVISDTTLGIPTETVSGVGGSTFLLAPTESATFYYETTATQTLTNTADATGTPTDPNGVPLGGDDVTSPPDTASVELPPVLGAIGDYVWYDASNDGVQDVDEVGIPNVTLELYADDDGTPGPSSGDTLLDTTVTGMDGGYIFTDLPAGDYYVDVVDATVPTGYTLTTGPQSETDPSSVVSLGTGEFYEDVDFGYVLEPGPGNAVIGDTVFYDADGDGVQDPGEPGIPGVTVIATDSDGNEYTDVTDENGHYLIEVPGDDSYSVAPDPTTLPPGLTETTPVPHITPVLVPGDQYLDADFGYDSPLLGTIGDQIWIDEDGTIPGVFEDGVEPGVPGVTVDLWANPDGSSTPNGDEYVVATTVTDENGQYLFTGLPAGNYLVTVTDTSNVLDDYVPTTIPGGTSNNLNKIDPYPVTLSAGGSNLTADFGYVADPNSNLLGIIGNQVWYETGDSINGLFEPENGDLGIEGIVIELVDTTTGSVLATQTTGSSGLYAFTSLPAGDYTVRVGDSTTYPENGTILAPYLPTVQIGGTDDNTDKDETGYQIILPDGGINMTGDFGYTDYSSLGDYIWWDKNGDGVQDPDEPGIPGVTVTLLDSNGDPVGAPTTTGPNGEYLFEDLLPGDYTVVVTPPTNGTPSPVDQTDDAADSDFGPDNQVDETLDLGEQNLTLDGGFVFDTRYEISKVRNTPGPVRVGDPISYTITITNLGTSIITALPLTDTYDADFLDYVSATPAPTTTDEPGGTLFWADIIAATSSASLSQGDSVSVLVEFVGIADTGTDAANNPNNNPTPPVTINVASSEGGTYDPDGPGGLDPVSDLPPVEDEEPVQIINPTSVTIATAAAGRSGATAVVHWTTADEVDIVGFDVLRLADGEAVTINSALIVAQFSGQVAGGTYTLVDGNPTMGVRNVYRLRIYMVDGRVEEHALGALNMTAGQIYLPIIR
jgi:uncharacterized repeat protein (TIGR01451 family)